MSVTIRRIDESDWAEYRAIRMRMLADTPIAYGETLAHAQSLPESTWRKRAARGDAQGSTILVAERDGLWVGVMGGWVSPEHGPMLVGVFVDPSARGRDAGVADALLAGIVEWAGGAGTTLSLEVHVDNPRAIRFYERLGFEATGRSLAYELPPFGREIEMRMELARVAEHDA